MPVEERREYINTEGFIIPRRQRIKLFGETGNEYIEDLLHHGESGVKESEVAEAFFRRLPDNLRLPPETEPLQFVNGIFHRAQECLYEARHDRLGILERDLHPRNEIAFLSAKDIARQLYYAASKNVDKTLSFESRRLLTVAIILAHFEARAQKFRVDDHMTEMLDMLNQDLWAEAPIGHTEALRIYTLHDDKTGEVLFPPSFSVSPLLAFHIENPKVPTHIKSREERVRYCRSNQGMSTTPVIFDARKKPDLARVLKVMRKTCDSPRNLVDLNQLVTDDVGLSFTPLALDIHECHHERFMDMCINVLQTHYGEGLVVVTDDAPDRLFTRRLVTAPGCLVPFEFFCYDPENYERYHREAYRIDPETGIRVLGRAHEIHKLRIDAPGLAALYPKRHYGIDIMKIIHQRQLEIAQQLLQQNKLTPEEVASIAYREGVEVSPEDI